MGQKLEGYVYGPYVTPDANSGFPAFYKNETASTGTSTSITTPPVDNGKYSGYDNIWREWWYSSNLNHTFPKPAYANDMTSKFSQYGAYYANLKATDADKVIYLTFDCGYENGNTEKILSILKAHNAKACFFVTKGLLDQAPQIAK